MMTTAEAEKTLREAEAAIARVVSHSRFLGVTDRKHLTQTARFVRLQAEKVRKHYTQQESERNA